MGIIRKQNDEAFWLGAEVGQTESVSHIPTQITKYEGINAPLTDWEYSFFKGYLLRGGKKRTNRVCLRITDHVKSIKIGSVTGYAFIQNCQTYDSNCCFILMNSNKKKIDKQGAILPEGDKSCYGTKFSSDFLCDLPSGLYYYREIRMSKSKLIEEDIAFSVIDNDDIQYVYIDHAPNLFKMYYQGNFSEEDVFPDLSKYYNDIDTSTSVFTSSYYMNSNSLSFAHNYTMKPLWRTYYNITGVEYSGKDVSGLFNFGWIDDVMSASNCGISKLPYNDDCITAIKLGNKRGTVDVNKSGSLTEDRYNIYKSYGLKSNPNDVTLPTYMYMQYFPTSQQYQSVARTFYMMENPKYECDIKWDDISQVVLSPYDYTTTGYRITHNHISGEYCVSYNANVVVSKKSHFIIKSKSRTTTTLKKEIRDEYHMWEGSREDTTTVSGGESITTPVSTTFSPPFDVLKSIGVRAARVYFEDKCIPNIPTLQTLFYYESNKGDIEACSDYSKHISDDGNPTISDENISRAFIGTSIVYKQIKQGYEDYDF